MLRTVFLTILAALACTATAAIGAPKLALSIDPPIYISNQSAAPVKVMWQTVWPRKALSPPREATIPSGAVDLKAERGVFWHDDPRSARVVDNMIFVTVLGADGKLLAQKAVDEAIVDSFAAVEAKALYVTVGADMAIELSAK